MCRQVNPRYVLLAVARLAPKVTVMIELSALQVRERQLAVVFEENGEPLLLK